MAASTTSPRAKIKLPAEVRNRREQVLRYNMPNRRRWDKTTGYPVFRSTARGVVVGTTTEAVGVWNLWRDGVTSSLLEAFANDRGVTALKYVDGWTSRETPMGIAWGTMMHDILYPAYDLFNGLSHDTIMTGVESGEPIEEFIQAYDKAWRLKNPDPSTEGLQTHYLCQAFARAVLPSYFKRWIGDFTGKYTFMENTAVHPKRFVGAEKEFKVAYTYPDGMVVWLRGKRDLVFQDKNTDEWIQDTKCLSQINDKEIIRNAPIDQQQNIYMYARLLEGIRAGRGFDAMPMGNVKNIIRRPAHRRKETEDLATFMERVKGDVSDVDQWDVKDKKGTTGWFVRYVCQMPESELLDWAENWLDPLMMDLRMWHDGITPNYMTQKGLTTKYGPSEMFAAAVDKNFNNLYRREKPFPELD